MSDTASTVREIDGRAVPTPGTYGLDTAHTTIEFVGRHLMITKVRGRFTDFSGEITIGEEPKDSSVEVVIDAGSVESSEPRRDEHLRSADFFDVEQYPTISFRSTGVEQDRSGLWKVTGDLTVKDVTRPVVLEVEFDGAQTSPWGDLRVGFSASTELNREDWGLTWNQTLETGGVVVGKKARIELNVEAIRK
jgi:polyisoprenoid-binding protein YceI